VRSSAAIAAAGFTDTPTLPGVEEPEKCKQAAAVADSGSKQ